MGCGQSKIHLYPRKSKSKANGKKSGHADSDAETDEDEGHIEDGEKQQQQDQEKNDENDEQQSAKDGQDQDEEVSVSLLRAKNLSLLQSQEISSSQQNFFRMLDKKIEEGPDYDSASETEIALEEARLNALVQHWESASLTASICSSASRSLQTTPIRQAPMKQFPPRMLLQTTASVPQHMLNADFLPHAGALQMAGHQVPVGVGSLKLTQNQQLVFSQMNATMLQQMGAVAPMPLAIDTETATNVGAGANASTNALAILQAPVGHHTQNQQFTHLLTLPAGGSPQLLTKLNVSPKRMTAAEARQQMLSTNSMLQQQQQQQFQTHLQNQYLASSGITGVQQPAGYLGSARSPAQSSSTQLQAQQQGMMPMQLAYYAQHTAQPQQQQQQATVSHLAATQSDQQQQQQQMTQNQQQQQQQQQQPQPQQYYGDMLRNTQQAAAPTEYRFPPAISVQRLAPQVQRQIRETQELIKDSCPQLYAAGYGSPGPPIRSQNRNQATTNRRPTLETQFSQELS